MKLKLPIKFLSGISLAVDPNVGGGVDRDKLQSGDFAGKNRSFPIVTQADVSDALQSIGRAGADNYSHDELRSRIISIAKRKGFTVSGEKEAAETSDTEDNPQSKVVAIRPRSRRRINSAGPRNVPSDNNGDRVTLPPDLTRTKVKGPIIASSEDKNEEDVELNFMDFDIEYPKLDMTAPAVQYKNSSDSGNYCQDCRFYDPDGDGDAECSLVAGNIRPLGTCNLFEEPFAGYEDDDNEPSSELIDPNCLCEVQLGEFVIGAEFAEGKPIQIMKTGNFNHPTYGDFSITKSDLDEIVQNFNDNVRGQSIPIDIDHAHGQAVGWMNNLSIVDGDKLFATPDWTDEGAQAVAGGKYRYFSPHFGPWEDPESKKKYRVVLMSGAVTNFPFLKNMEPLSLSEFSMGEKEKGARMDLTEAEVQELQRKLSEAETVANEARTQVATLTERATAAETASTQLSERLLVIEHDNRVRELTSIVNGNGDPNKHWIGNADEQVTFMLSLAEKFGQDSPEFKHYVDEQIANATRIRTSGLFKEIGSRAAGASDAPTAFEAKLSEVMATGKSRAEAIMAVAKANPSLYKEYNDATVVHNNGKGE